MQALHASGQSLPMPLKCRGLIDTGTDVTCIVPHIVTTLGLIPSNPITTQTAAGPVWVRFYEVSLTLYDQAAAPGSDLFRPVWTVTCLPQDLPSVDVLIGMDLLAQVILNVDGPGRRFTLSF
jgi:hypothetical protein